MTHRWGHSKGIALGAGSNDTKVYGINTLYDPEYATGVG